VRHRRLRTEGHTEKLLTSAQGPGSQAIADVVDLPTSGPGDSNGDSNGKTHTTEFSSRTTANGGVGGTRVVAWTVFGCGHSWPGAPTPDWAEPTTQEFDAAEKICASPSRSSPPRTPGGL
jgi:hypothetical protein